MRAALVGIDLDKEKGKQLPVESMNEDRNEGVSMFQSLDNYNHLSQQQKEELTKKMKGAHRVWAKRMRID